MARRTRSSVVPAGGRGAALLVLLGLLACKASAGEPDLRARVTCEGTPNTIDCDVAHVAGAAEATVCWDLQFDCQNGAQVTGSGFCQSVQPNATAQRRIPLTDLSNAEQCDTALSSRVTNLKVTAL